jgi:hypothetical protein
VAGMPATGTAAVKELLELTTERFDRLSLVGCVFDLEARIRWLDVVKETL